MTKPEEQTKPALESEAQKTIEKEVVTKETINSKRVEDAGDRLAEKMKENTIQARNRFSEKSPTFKEKAESLFSKMMEKVQEVKDRIKATSEMVRGRSQKGAETGIKTEQALADLQKNLEMKSPDEQKASLVKGIELVVAVQVMQKSGEAPQRTESGRGETERVLLEDEIPIGMRIPVSGQVTFRQEGRFENKQQEFFSDKDLEKYKGSMSQEGGVISFVDRQGKAWVTGDTPQNQKALKDAGYRANSEMPVPLARGEDLSEHNHDASMLSYKDKWNNIKEAARRKRDAGEAQVSAQQSSEKKAA